MTVGRTVFSPSKLPRHSKTNEYQRYNVKSLSLRVHLGLLPPELSTQPNILISLCFGSHRNSELLLSTIWNLFLRLSKDSHEKM